MRVVLCQRQIASDGRGGGLGTLYANLAAGLQSAGLQVAVVTATRPEDVGVAGVEVVSISRPSPDPAAYARQVSAALDGLDFDLAECASWKAELADYAARPARRPVVVRGELPAPVLGLSAPAAALERVLLACADGILAVSQTVAELVAAHYGRQVDAVVYNAVDFDLFRPPPAPRAPEGPLRGVWVGSHAPVKRIDMLEAVVRAAPEVQFDVVIPYREDDARLARLRSGPNVRLHHGLAQEEMTRLYWAADVLLSTSRIEAFGLGILEAMACGTPVLIPAEIGGPAEFVRQGVDGYFYRSVEEAVAHLRGRDWRRGRDDTIQYARRFTWEQTVAQTVAAYTQIAGGSAGYGLAK